MFVALLSFFTLNIEKYVLFFLNIKLPQNLLFFITKYKITTLKIKKKLQNKLYNIYLKVGNNYSIEFIVNIIIFSDY